MSAAPQRGVCAPLWGVRDPSVDVCDPRGVCDPLGASVPPSRAGCEPSQGVRPPHGVPQLPSRGVSALPLTGYLCLSHGLSQPPHGIFVPPLGICPAPAPGAAHILLSSPWLLPSCPSLFLLWCFGVCSERQWERGCSPGSWGARRLVLPSPSLLPPGTSKLSRWRELRCIQGAQGRLEAPGFRRSPPALWDTCDLLFCVLFYLPHSLPFPQSGPAEKSLGNSLSRLSLPSACVRAREGK